MTGRRRQQPSERTQRRKDRDLSLIILCAAVIVGYLSAMVVILW